MRYLLLMTALLLASLPLWAQAGGGGAPTGGGVNSETLMVNTAKGLFVLRAGVLGKFTIAPLKQVQELPLFGPAPEVPKDVNDRDARQKYFAEIQRRRAPAIMLVKDNFLLIVVGDGFVRVNQDTLKVEATGDLKLTAPADGAADATRMGRSEPAPGYLLVDNTLYLMRSTELQAVSVMDGKVTRTPLSKEMLPFQMPAFNNPGGRGGGGNRGGGQ